MEIMAGEAEVLLPGSEQWLSVSSGKSFTVLAQAQFQIKVNQPTDYCCSYM